MDKYVLNPEGGVVLSNGNRVIPEDERNRHWQEYLEWVADGNTAKAPPAAPPKPNEELLDESDQKMIRALDWLLEYLVTNGLTNGKLPLADIPAQLKALYQERKNLRGVP